MFKKTYFTKRQIFKSILSKKGELAEGGTSCLTELYRANVVSARSPEIYKN